MVEWRMKGQWLKNCNCAFGCPCDFNALPTHGYCEGMWAMNIAEGNYGDVPLSGLKWVAIGKWPGPIHEGNGTLQHIIDTNADESQRRSLLSILSGGSGSRWYEIISSVCSNVLEPRFAEIDFEFDLEKRQAYMSVKDICETKVEPIKNPVTGVEHCAQITLPNGFEYKVAEMGNATALKVTGEIKFDHSNVHSSLAEVEQTSEGLKA